MSTDSADEWLTGDEVAALEDEPDLLMKLRVMLIVGFGTLELMKHHDPRPYVWLSQKKDYTV